MNNILKIASLALPLLLPLAAANTHAADNWRRISYQDFGGNSEDDTRFSSTPLSGDYGTSGIGFAKDGVSTSGGRYSLGKYPKNYNGSTPDGWLIYGDHTHQDSMEVGYFLMLDPSQACGCGALSECGGSNTNVDYSKTPIYQCTLSENLCPGVTFKFEAFVANMQSAAYANIKLGIYDKDDNVLWESNDGEGEEIPGSDPGAGHYNWKHISGVFTIPDNIDLSEIKFRVSPAGDGICSSTVGYDFGLDDISIYIKQPGITIDTTHIEYMKPCKLTAKLEDEKFFADMNDVSFFWEYSPDGKTGWREVGGTRTYAQYQNFEYVIDEFDKDNAEGKGNGYYRLTMATTGDINSLTEMSVCCLRQVYQIHETKNKFTMILCDGETQKFDGMTFSTATDGKTLTTSHNFDVTTEVIFNTDSISDFRICVGQSWPEGSSDPADIRKTVNLTGEVLSTGKAIQSKRISYTGNTCDSITPKGILYVDDLEKVVHEENPCVGDLNADGKAWTDVQTVKIQDTVGCELHMYTINVRPTYRIEETRYECDGFTYNGKAYTPGEYDLQETKFQTAIYGCDSIEKLHVVVNPKAEKYLDTLYFCQSDFGKGKPVFSFGGEDFVNDTRATVTKMGKMVIENGSYLNCDSTVFQPIVIYPLLQVERDTLICRDQILFGKEWTVAGNYDYEMRSKTDNGCELVTIYHIEVLSAQLRLRTDVKANNVCLGQAAAIHADILPYGLLPEWEPEISTPDPMNPKVVPSEDVTYICHVYRQADGHTCHTTDSIKITVSDSPVLTLDSVSTMERVVDFQVQNGTGDYTYWIGNAANNVSEFDPSNDKYFHEVTPNITSNDGTVTFGTLDGLTFGTLLFRVVDEMGCATEDTIHLEPQPIEPAVVFTPNGDGINDRWEIKNIEAYGADAFVRIYTRFGKLVYESDRKVGYNNANGFDGTHNGVKLPSTDYWYIIDLENLDRQYVGHFSLLR